MSTLADRIVPYTSIILVRYNYNKHKTHNVWLVILLSPHHRHGKPFHKSVSQVSIQSVLLFLVSSWPVHISKQTQRTVTFLPVHSSCTEAETGSILHPWVESVVKYNNPRMVPYTIVVFVSLFLVFGRYLFSVQNERSNEKHFIIYDDKDVPYDRGLFQLLGRL